jgi:2'-5' RNA ligase
VTVRCFAALPIPAAAREALAAALQPFLELGWPVRWVRPEGVHVTLKFFGEVPRERADAIAESLDYAVAGIGPLALSLSAFGAFPGPDRVRVLWAGVEAPSALELLQDRVETRAEELGFASEGIIFRPHVTLGRVREGERVPRAESERLFAAPLSASFTVDRVMLYESTLREGGAEYTALHTAALKG